MIRRPVLAALLAAPLLLAACGQVPSLEEIEDAKAHASAAVKALDRGRAALELLGLMPVYTCGEPRRTFIGRAADGLRADWPCAVVSLEAEGESADLATLTFPVGCEALERSLAGEALFRYSGGEDRLELEADFRTLLVAGTALPAKAGYGTCGDESRYWALAEGPLTGDYAFKVDLHVGKRGGLPVFGGTSLLVDGTGALIRAAGSDQLTLTAIEYEVGEYLPKQGTLLIETASGGRLEVGFEPSLWRFGEATVRIGDKEPVTIPIAR